MSDPLVSVVVPTYQRAQRLPALVHALEHQSLDPDEFEVILVSDGSTDESVDVLHDLMRDTPIQLRCEPLPVNRGAAHARNAGASLARAPILAFTDDDCQPDPGWLDAGIRAFDADDVHVVQGRTEPVTPAGPWAATRDITSFTGIYEACNVFYRSEAFRSVGGFDELLGWFCEDTAVGLAVVAAGGSSAFAPDALVLHDVSYPGWRWWLRHAWLHRNWNVLVKRHPRLRNDLLWQRWFFRRRHPLVLLGLAGLALSWLHPLAAALAVPWAIRRGPRKLSREGVANGVKRMAMDVAVVGSLIIGSVQHRCLVL